MYTVRYLYDFQARTVTEGFCANIRQPLGKCDLFETSAVSECIISYLEKTVRKADLF